METHKDDRGRKDDGDRAVDSHRARRRKRRVFMPSPPGLPGGQYRPLSVGDIRRVHEASLQVLEKTGVEVGNCECRDVFRAAGARLDDAAGRAFLPAGMVEDAIASARSEVLLSGRDPENDIVLSGTRVHMGTGGAAIKVIDLETQEVRPSTLADVALIGRLVDALHNIHFYLRACVARDIPNEHLDLNTFYAALTNTSKHVTGNCTSLESLRQVIEMAALIAGGRANLRERPIISLTTGFMISPLRFAADMSAVLSETVRQEIPVFLASAPQSGATGPAALAGTLVQLNAEELAGLTFCQLVKPGSPVVLGYVPSVSDLRTGKYVSGAVEFALMNAAAAQLSQFYNIPVYNSAGLTDAKLPDAQAGYEKGITGLAAALAGSNYIHHTAGMLESLLTVAYEQFVIDDDINGSIMRAVRGIRVDDETLSVDLIDEVVRGERHYLGTRQSADMSVTEYYYPHTGDRQHREQWESQGRLDIRERARRQARDILESHRPEPLPEGMDAEIRRRFTILLPEELANLPSE